MAEHFVNLQSSEETKLLFDCVNKAFPPDKFPFSISATQKPPQPSQGSSDGQRETIRITISGVGDNPRTLTYSASPVDYLKAHPGESNATFQAARIAIKQAVEQWWESEVAKAKNTSATSTQN
jgi:hypothetical protein